jgi:hypothetical protein
MSDRSGDWSRWGVFLVNGLSEGRQNLIREYCLVVVYVVIGDLFCVYVESFKRVKVWSFSVVS